MATVDDWDDILCEGPSERWEHKGKERSQCPRAGLVSVGKRGCGDFVNPVRIAPGRAMPDAATIGSDVDLVAVGGIGNHAVSPLEVKSTYPLPVPAPIPGAPGGGFEACGVEDPGISRIRGDVVNVLILRQNVTPAFAAIERRIDASSLGLGRSAAAPGGKQQMFGIPRINGETVGAIHSCGQVDSRPMFGAVG